MLKSFSILILFCFASLSQAEERIIYKKYNDEGIIEFSDVPDKENIPVHVPEMNTYKQKAFPTTFQQKVEPDTATTHYTKLNITMPLNDTMVRENSGNVSISLELEPSLNSAHQFKIVLNAEESTAIRGQKLSLSFANISRGSHKVQAFVVDKAGKILIKSKIILFHLKRFAVTPKANP